MMNGGNREKQGKRRNLSQFSQSSVLISAVANNQHHQQHSYGMHTTIWYGTTRSYHRQNPTDKNSEKGVKQYCMYCCESWMTKWIKHLLQEEGWTMGIRRRWRRENSQNWYRPFYFVSQHPSLLPYTQQPMCTSLSIQHTMKETIFSITFLSRFIQTKKNKQTESRYLLF